MKRMDLGIIQGNPLQPLYQYAGQVGSRIYFDNPPPDPPPDPPPTPPTPPEGLKADGWKGQLGDLGTHPSLASFSDDGEGLMNVAKSLVNVQPILGLDKIPIPGKDAGEDVWKEVYTRLGRPENVDGYGYERPKSLPQGFPVNEEFEQGFLGAAHKAGLNPTQLKIITDFYFDHAGKEFAALGGKIEKDMADAEIALRKTWGNAYQQNLTLVDQVMGAFANEEFKVFLEDTGLGNMPEMNKFLAEIGKAMSEDKLIGKPKLTFKSPAEAQAEIDRLFGDEEFMKKYTDKSHPMHKQAVDQMSALQQAAHPEEA